MPKSILSDKRSLLYVILCGIILTNALIAELIGVKIFSGEAVLGLMPAQLNLFGKYTLDFNLTSGALIWPIIFITTDIINEYFGKKGVRRISFITAFFIAYMFLVISITTLLPPAQFWIDVNREPRSFDINVAFNRVYSQGMGIIIGSLVAFLIGQLLDNYVFQNLRKFTGNKMMWLRATGSTLVSQFVDSFVVLIIAFYIFGKWQFSQVIAVGIINYIYKFSVAVLLTPVLYFAHRIIDKFLGKDTSEEMIREASMDTSFF